MNRLKLTYIIAAATAILFLTPACKKIANPDPINSGGDGGSALVQRLKTVKEIGGWSADLENIQSNKVNMTFDNSDVYILTLTDGKVTSIELLNGVTATIDYDINDNITRTEQDFNAFKLTNNLTYNSSGFVNSMEGVTSTKQMDGSYTDETTYTLTNINSDADGVKSFDLTTFVAGMQYQEFAVTVNNSTDDNPFYQSGTFCALFEFNDQFNNMFYYSPKVITDYTMVNISSSDTLRGSFDAQMDSQGEIVMLDIIPPNSSKISMEYTYR